MPSPSGRREQIWRAALRVFARKGYRNAVVEDVASEAGVAKGTVYTYFDRKEELLGAVYHGLMAEMRERQGEILGSDRPPLEKLRELLRTFVDLFGGNDAFARVMLDIWVAGMQDPEEVGIDFAALYAEYRALVRRLLEQAEARGDIPDDRPEVTPAVLIGAVEGMLLQWVLDPEGVAFPDAANDILDVLYHGLYHGIRSPDSS